MFFRVSIFYKQKFMIREFPTAPRSPKNKNAKCTYLNSITNFSIPCFLIFLGILLQKQPCPMIDDADFDGRLPNYQETLEMLCMKGYDYDDSDSEAELLSDVINEVGEFARRPDHVPPPPFKIGKIFFTKHAYDVAHHWRGNFIKPLSEAILDRKAQTAKPCQTMVNDPRILVGEKVSLIFFTQFHFSMT